MISYFDTNINIHDEEFALQVKSIDNKGLAKFANFIDALRALVNLSQTNWFLFHIKSGPIYEAYNEVLEICQRLSDLEFYEITPQHLACVSQSVSNFRKLLESEIEKGTISQTTFTSPYQMAILALPVTIALYDTIEEWYLEAHNNSLAILDLEAIQSLGYDFQIAPNDFKMLWQSENYCASGDSDDGPKDFQTNPHQSEESLYFSLMSKYAKTLDLMNTNPQSAKSLMGQNLIDILRLTARFYRSRGQDLIKELKDSKTF